MPVVYEAPPHPQAPATSPSKQHTPLVLRAAYNIVQLHACRQVVGREYVVLLCADQAVVCVFGGGGEYGEGGCGE